MTDPTGKKRPRKTKRPVADELLVMLRDAVALSRFAAHLDDGGVYLPGQHPVEPAQSYDFMIVHPDGGQRLKLSGTVVRIDSEPPAGVAVLLSELDELVQMRIANFAKSSGAAEGSVYERISKLGGAEQRKLAKSRNLDERVAVERLLGKIIWEDLLRNPNITPPEVTRIAKRHDLPVPLVSLIVDGEKWLRIPEVRRALLANPRLSGGSVTKLLRLFNRTELAKMLKERGLSAAVRIEAQKLIGAHKPGGARPPR